MDRPPFDSTGFLSEAPSGPATRIRSSSSSLAGMSNSELASLKSNDMGNGHEIHARTEEEAEILRKAIPASTLENKLSAVGRKSLVKDDAPTFKRGDKAIHKSADGRKTKVVIAKCDVGVTAGGEIQHEVMIHGGSRKFKVPESKLRKL